MWKEFKFSAKRPLTRILIIGVIAAVTIVNLGLEFIMSALLADSSVLNETLLEQLTQYGLTSSAIFDIIYFLLITLLISSFVRGIISSNFGALFGRADENTIIPSPIAPHALYAAKKLKGFVLHSLTVATILLAGYPFLIRVGFQGFGFVVLFIALLTAIEINGLIENVSYCISRALLKKGTRLRKLALMAFFALALFVVVSPFLLAFGEASDDFVVFLYPPYACSMILTLRPSLDVTLAVFSLLAEFTFFLFAASTIAKIGLRTWASSPRLVQTRSNFIPLEKNRLAWKRGRKGSAYLVFMKDLWVTIRNPSKFFIPLGVSLVLLLFSAGVHTLLLLPSEQPTIQQSTDAVIIPSIFVITAFILSPAWESFASERHTLFILKGTPIKTSRIIWSKYVFGLIRSVSYTAPLIAAISLLLPATLNIFLITTEVLLVLLVTNALGILASVSYPPAYRGIGPPPYLILLGLPVLSITLTAIIPITLLQAYPLTTLSGVIPALAVFCFLLVTRVRARALILVIPILLLLFYQLATPSDFAFAFMPFYVFIVVTSCLKTAEKSFRNLEEFHTHY